MSPQRDITPVSFCISFISGKKQAPLNKYPEEQHDQDIKKTVPFPSCSLHTSAKGFWLLPIKEISILKLSSSDLHYGTQQQVPVLGHIQPILVVVGADQIDIYCCSLSLVVIYKRVLAPLDNGMLH